MSVNIEWDVVHELVSPYGSLPLNTAGPALSSGLFPVFLIMPPYSIVPADFRAVRDNVSQSDGSSIQPPYISGLQASLTVQYWTQVYADDTVGREAACAQDLREMDERLMLHLNALRSCSTDPDTLQRLMWTPSGLGDDRMLQGVFLSSWAAPDFTQGPPLVQTAFQMISPYPYAVDATATVTPISSGGSATITNSGNIGEKPLIVVAGGATTFAITNVTSGRAVHYDGTRPGAHGIAGTDSATIDFFLSTITQNDGEDLVAGLVPTSTDFFTLDPGSNTLSVSGADIVVLSRNAVV